MKIYQINKWCSRDLYNFLIMENFHHFYDNRQSKSVDPFVFVRGDELSFWIWNFENDKVWLLTRHSQYRADSLPICHSVAIRYVMMAFSDWQKVKSSVSSVQTVTNKVIPFCNVRHHYPQKCSNFSWAAPNRWKKAERPPTRCFIVNEQISSYF